MSTPQRRTEAQRRTWNRRPRMSTTTPRMSTTTETEGRRRRIRSLRSYYRPPIHEPSVSPASIRQHRMPPTPITPDHQYENKSVAD